MTNDRKIRARNESVVLSLRTIEALLMVLLKQMTPCSMVRLLFLTSLLLTILNRKRSMKQEEKLSKQDLLQYEFLDFISRNKNNGTRFALDNHILLKQIAQS
ncbi:unnamed protein product [Mucor fragilis]